MGKREHTPPKKGEPAEAQPGSQVSVTATKRDDKAVLASTAVTLAE